MNTSTNTPASTQTCPKCDYANSQKAQYCERCRTELSGTLLQAPGATLPAAGASSAEFEPDAIARNADRSGDRDPHVPRAASLVHAETGQRLDLDPHGFVWRVGKPHQGTSPDLDLTQFPHAEIVSRAHALIRYDRGQYYLEDTNSSNGTFVNRKPLIPGRRYPLNDGDYVVFGKGDLVSFLFEISAA